MNKQGFRFDIKTLDEAEGTFEGVLSVYGVVDIGKDSVERGSFTKSISERGNEVPLLWQHDAKQPIGILELHDTEDALLVKGRLVLEVAKAREALALMKGRALKGLSIGYDPIKWVMEGPVRKLKELRLWEGSLVTFPMLPIAQVDLSSVKSEETKDDFDTALGNIQTYSMRYQLIAALESSLDSIILGEDSGTKEERAQQVAIAIEQFRQKYLEFVPRWMTLVEGYKTLITDLLEQKVGRRISAANRSKIEETIANLQALLAEPADEQVTEEAEAAKYDQEPEFLHSWMSDLTKDIKGELQCKN